jgi:hypothetical protein
VTATLRGKLIVDVATREIEGDDPNASKDPAGAAVGRRGVAARWPKMARNAHREAEKRWKRQFGRRTAIPAKERLAPAAPFEAPHEPSDGGRYERIGSGKIASL